MVPAGDSRPDRDHPGQRRARRPDRHDGRVDGAIQRPGSVAADLPAPARHQRSPVRGTRLARLCASPLAEETSCPRRQLDPRPTVGAGICRCSGSPEARARHSSKGRACLFCGSSGSSSPFYSGKKHTVAESGQMALIAILRKMASRADRRGFESRLPLQSPVWLRAKTYRRTRWPRARISSARKMHSFAWSRLGTLVSKRTRF